MDESNKYHHHNWEYSMDIEIKRTKPKFIPYEIIIHVTSHVEQEALAAMAQYDVTIPNACNLNLAEKRIVCSTLQGINRAITAEKAGQV